MRLEYQLVAVHAEIRAVQRADWIGHVRATGHERREIAAGRAVQVQPTASPRHRAGAVDARRSDAQRSPDHLTCGDPIPIRFADGVETRVEGLGASVTSSTRMSRSSVTLSAREWPQQDAGCRSGPMPPARARARPHPSGLRRIRLGERRGRPPPDWKTAATRLRAPPGLWGHSPGAATRRTSAVLTRLRRRRTLVARTRTFVICRLPIGYLRALNHAATCAPKTRPPNNKL